MPIPALRGRNRAGPSPRCRLPDVVRAAANPVPAIPEDDAMTLLIGLDVRLAKTVVRGPRSMGKS